MNDLRQRVLSGSLWSILAELLASGGRALSYFIYARLLTPDDFGLVGFAVLCISLFPLLIDNSLSLTLINAKEDNDATFSTIFFLNAGLAFLAAILLIPASAGAAYLLGDSRITFVLPLMGLQVICNGLCATHIAVARRRFQFRRLVWVRLISTTLSLATGLSLAFAGFTYWALVAGTVMGGFAQMVAAWVMLRWHPKLIFNWVNARVMAGFAAWVAVDMGISWLVVSGGGFFLAFFLGAHELGLFRLSDQLNATVMGTVFGPLIPVFYSAFCETASSQQQSQVLFQRINHDLAVMVMALLGCTIVIAYPLERLIGGGWYGIGDLIILNAVADGISYLMIVVPSVLRAQGNAKIVAGMRIILLMGQIAVYSFVARQGLKPFLIGKIGLEVGMYALSFALIGRALSVSSWRLVKGHGRPALFVAVGAAAGTGGALLALPYGSIAGLMAGLGGFTLMLGGYLWIWERPCLRDIHAMMKKRLSPDNPIAPNENFAA